MQRIELEPTHFNFFCPVTGQRITDEELFIPSPAQLFCYIDEGVFEFVHKDIHPALEHVGIDITTDVIEADWQMFEKLIVLLDDQGLVLFEITHSGMACGPISMTAYHCIDMNFDIDSKMIID